MKINGSDVKIITLKHDNKDLKFKCYIEPISRPFAEKEFPEGKEVQIVFDDTGEVFSLLAMLQKFKKEIESEIGFWRLE